MSGVNPEMNYQGFCRPCNARLEFYEGRGKTMIYRCPSCNSSIEISLDRPSIVLDKTGLPGTTLNGGPHYGDD